MASLFWANDGNDVALDSESDSDCGGVFWIDKLNWSRAHSRLRGGRSDSSSESDGFGVIKNFDVVSDLKISKKFRFKLLTSSFWKSKIKTKQKMSIKNYRSCWILFKCLLKMNRNRFDYMATKYRMNWHSIDYYASQSQRPLSQYENERRRQWLNSSECARDSLLT